MVKILALDVGEKRIGVARADSTTRIAVPVGYINVDGSEWQEIARIARSQGSVFFVIGLPRSNEGNETKQSVYVRNFARTLTEKIPEARIRFQDESLTSVEAESRLKQRQKRYEKGDIDAEAAAIILQDFLESFKEPAAKQPETTNITEEKGEKVSKRTKAVTKWITGVAIVLILGLLATGVALWIRDQRYKEYAEMFAQQEAEMEAEVFNFTIRPGETIYEVRDNLIEVGYSATEVDAALAARYDFDFLQGRPEGATLEGYLYGETYEFYDNTPVTEVVEQFLKDMGEVIDENHLKERYEAMGLSLYEGITLASIVQKEAGSLTPEMPTVAQVFLSRLEYGIPLGSDVTVSYALDTIDPDRETYSDNQAALTVDSCYNTRIYAGLPCGPISNPGLAALLAVAEPSDTAYLYFLTGDDGMMYYSSTDSGHIQNARDHCQELCNISL
ncbi:endolytic transglycosylase MltG [Candidatus Saccharibacteria bacterium]|nr:endolytic transglycosylase MltG [Candidatus Saccharibacteria bacterium]